MEGTDHPDSIRAANQMADVLKRLGRVDEATALREKYGGTGNFDYDLSPASPQKELYDEVDAARIAASKAFYATEEAKNEQEEEPAQDTTDDYRPVIPSVVAQDLRTSCASAAQATALASQLAVSQGLNVPRPTEAEVAEFKREALKTCSVSPGVSLKTLEDLVSHAEKKGLAVDDLTWRDVYDNVIVPYTSQVEPANKSYAECLPEHLRGPHHFYVAHSWSVNFKSSVELIVASASAMMPDEDPKKIFVWIDMLCRKTRDSSGAPLPALSLVSDTMAAIASCSGPTLLCMDGDGDVLALAWIQFEAWCTAHLKGGHMIRVICDEMLETGKLARRVRGLDPFAAKCRERAEHEAILGELAKYKALDDFPTILCHVFLQGANSEAQDFSEKGSEVPKEYLSSSLHKCGVFAAACGLTREAQVRMIQNH